MKQNEESLEERLKKDEKDLELERLREQLAEAEQKLKEYSELDADYEILEDELERAKSELEGYKKNKSKKIQADSKGLEQTVSDLEKESKRKKGLIKKIIGYGAAAIGAAAGLEYLIGGGCVLAPLFGISTIASLIGYTIKSKDISEEYTDAGIFGGVFGGFLTMMAGGFIEKVFSVSEFISSPYLRIALGITFLTGAGGIIGYLTGRNTAVEENKYFNENTKNLATVYRNRDIRKGTKTRWLKKIIEENPESYEAHALLGAHYVERTEFSNALRELVPLLEKNPEDDLVLYDLSRAYRMAGYFDRRYLHNALNMAQKAISLNPNRFEFHISLGEIYIDLGEHEKAEQEAERAANLARGGYYESEAKKFLEGFRKKEQN